MAYNQNIPQANDRLKDSQSDLLDNFQSIKTLIDINHVTFDDPSGDQGKHFVVTFPVQSPAPTITAPDIGLYSFNNAITGRNELYFQPQTGSAIPTTASLKNATGFTYLPSGILLKWGSGTATAGSSTFTFPVAPNIPAFTSILNVQISPFDTSASDSNNYVRIRSFTILNIALFATQRTTTTNASCNFYWLAIGA